MTTIIWKIHKANSAIRYNNMRKLKTLYRFQVVSADNDRGSQKAFEDAHRAQGDYPLER